MSYVTLEQAKAHLAVVHSDDDVLIQDLIDAAESYAASYMGRENIDGSQYAGWIGGNDNVSSSEAAPQAVPPAVVQAIKILVFEYYENRGQFVVGASVAENPTVARLLHFHRVGLGV